MKKFLGLLIPMVLFSIPLMAQVTPRFEGSAGYLYDSFQTSSGYSNSLHLNGWYGSLDYNPLRRIGAELQLSEGVKNQGTVGDNSFYTVMIGPQIYPFGHRRLTVYGHVLVGEGYFRIAYPAFGGFPATVTSDSSLVWQAGAGAEMSVKKKWGIRLLEADYGHSDFFGARPGQGSIRISFGFVYRFGSK
jgi:Outer membrane protein beta-barrel domain